MKFEIKETPTPIRWTDQDYARVGETRVSLETVIYYFNQGATPEEIVYNFTTLELADVYQVIAFYLRNKAVVDAYIQESERKAEEIRQKFEAMFPTTRLREKLLARREAMKKNTVEG